MFVTDFFSELNEVDMKNVSHFVPLQKRQFKPGQHSSDVYRWKIITNVISKNGDKKYLEVNANASFNIGDAQKYLNKMTNNNPKFKVLDIVKSFKVPNVVENMDHSKDGDSVDELKSSLLSSKKEIFAIKDDEDKLYDMIDKMMTRIAKSHGISGQKLHDLWVKKYKLIPDEWILKQQEIKEDNNEYVVFVNGKAVSRSKDRFEVEKDLEFLLSKGYKAELKKLQCKYVSLNESKSNQFVKNYLPWLQKELGLKKLPKIKLLDMPEDTTFGKYGGGTLYVVTGGRHPIDVLRTLAHELTHFKQDLNDELTPGAGETGTPQENEANSNAGIIMRTFAQSHPEEFGLEQDLNEEIANQKIRFADGYVVFSNHFKERLKQRNISVESILRLLHKVESRREEDLINMPFVNFVIKSNDLGISLKKEKNGDRTVYVASTVHPDLNVGSDEDVIYLEDLEVNETIRKVKGGYKVLSKKGKNLGGPYKSKSQAAKRLGQVEYFKHAKEDINEFAPPKDDGDNDSDDAINHLKAMAASWCKNPNPRIERELRDLGYHINMLKSQNGVILYPLDKSYDTIKFSKEELFPQKVDESIKNRPPSLRKIAGVKEGEKINHTHLLRLRGRINTMKNSKNKNTRNRGIQLERQVQTFKNFHPMKNPAVGAQVMESEILAEGRAHPVIVVDVQPEYSGMNDGDENSVFTEIINFVNQQTGPVLMFVNAEDQGLSGDTLQSIKEYWDDSGFAPENWRRVQIVDKGYGYFRSWMDYGIEPATIIATIRELYQQKKSDSRELQFPASNRRTPQQSLIMGVMQEMNDEPLTVNWTSVAQLKRFNGAYIVGGARDQCLREVELLMNAFNIRYKRIDSLVYT